MLCCQEGMSKNGCTWTDTEKKTGAEPQVLINIINNIHLMQQQHATNLVTILEMHKHPQQQLKFS